MSLSSLRARLLNIYNHSCIQGCKSTTFRSLNKGKEISREYLSKGVEIGQKYAHKARNMWESSSLHEHEYVIMAKTKGQNYWNIASQKGWQFIELARDNWIKFDDIASKELKTFKEFAHNRGLEYGALAKNKGQILLEASKKHGSIYSEIAKRNSIVLLKRIEAFILGPVYNWYMIFKHLLRQIIETQDLGPPSLSSWSIAKSQYQEAFSNFTRQSVLDYTWGQVMHGIIFIVELLGFYYVGKFVGIGFKKITQ